MDWQPVFDGEIDKAVQARSRGNEGRARVCARRAAGTVAVEYLRRLGFAANTGSAIEALQHLVADSSLPVEVRSLAGHLVQPVGFDFKLPADIDLVAEATRIRELLLPE